MKIFFFEPKIFFDRQLIQDIDGELNFPSNINLDSYFPKELCVVVQNPELADFIIFPTELTIAIENLGLYRLLNLFDTCKLYLKYYWKFIFIYRADCSWKIPMSGTWLRTSYDKRILSNESISIPYLQNKNFKDTVHCTYKANFVGAIHTHPVRGKLISYLTDNDYWSDVLILIRDSFHHNPLIDKHKKEKRFREFQAAIKKSYMTFCPRGTGMNSIRFYETMSFGRIPVLFSEHCKLPFEEEIDYEEFSFDISYDKLCELSKMLNINSKQLDNMCNASRKIFLEYFSLGTYGAKLVAFLKMNKEKIHETRKFDNTFHCQVEKECLYDYFFDYLCEYEKDKEFVNVFESVLLLIKLTNDTKKIELLNFINGKVDEQLSFDRLNITKNYIKNLSDFLYNELSKKFSSNTITKFGALKSDLTDDLDFLTNIYVQKVL